ncbi:MAG TPA: GGDEF domain-containing protein [Candidatus Cloacimonetes bacterium]|nr:GGDEF domain-containing protein [Candidatus Cloacimonadota bacterium]
MIIMNLLKNWLIIVGALIMLISLSPIQKLKQQLPEGALRGKWDMLRMLILFFVASYLVFVVAQWNEYVDTSDLIVPFVFFFGAIFTLLTSSLAVQTARDILRITTLEQENITDPLMEIHNRRHFNRRLTEEMNRAHRYGTPLALFIIDIDHFKNVNDTYGHDTGDNVLKKIATLLQDHVRRTDIIARYGGEEIAIIAPETTMEVAEVLGERLRESIANAILVPANEEHPDIKATVSIGIAGIEKTITNNERFIQCADIALYEAKEQGRNRVVIYECTQSETM